METNYISCLAGSGALGRAMTSLTSTLTKTKMEMTAVGGGSAQRTVRKVKREHRSAAVFDDRGETDTADWWEYNDFTRKVWQPRQRKTKVKAQMVVAKPLHPDAIGVAMKEPIFGEGAERMVHKFREYDCNEQFVGPFLVAKESRFAEDVESAGSAAKRAQ
jgi:hypothetical protein